MKTWIKLLIIFVVCIVLVGAVYVWRFGWPTFENKEEKMLQTIYENISSSYAQENVQEYTTKAELNGNNIVITRVYNDDENHKIAVSFSYSNDVISSQTTATTENLEVFDEAILKVFEQVAVYNGYSAENARYSLIKDIVETKSLEDDGYQYTNMNNIARFMVAVDKKLNLANKEEVYIKESDLTDFSDILKNKLQYKLIEKPGIVFEKNISYSRNLVYVFYEKESLTNRTYTSLMNLLKVIVNDESVIEDVKANYPIITRAGTLTLDGITISLNENLGEGNIHYYEVPEDYEYMLVKINIDKYIK